MLSNRRKNRLVVAGRVNGRQSVDTCGKTSSNLSGKDASLSGRVKTLEESELVGIVGCSLSQRIKFLDDNVRVTNNLALSIELLRCGEVVRFSVDEITSLHVLDVHGDGESLVSRYILHVFGTGKFARGHSCRGGDLTHNRRVARSTLHLLAVRERLLCGRTEVDEIICRCQGSSLTVCRHLVTVKCESLGDDRGIKGCGWDSQYMSTGPTNSNILNELWIPPAVLLPPPVEPPLPAEPVD